MPLAANIKSEVMKRIEQYEGRFNHLYLDTKGKVTVGIGHLVPNRNAMATVMLYKLKNKVPFQAASLAEKQAEYDKTSKLPYGQRYGAGSFKSHTTLIMKDSDINAQRDKHVNSFYTELTNIYNKSNGYPDDFDKLHKNVQLALFDMIFNLGATKIVASFPSFNKALKASDWKKSATESNRPDVNAARNSYVKQLFNTVPVVAKPAASMP
ncbi:MAG: hypothetical protein COB33_002025 [Thiotrichaceae bacterium]|nr:hypothetical protein [Thiotrichaceae bacterium]